MGCKTLSAVALAVTIAAAFALAVPAEAAQQKKQRVTAQKQTRQVVVNRPRARIVVQRRSFLDAGTEVLPGERKYNEYAMPTGYRPMGVIENTAFNRSTWSLPGPFELPRFGY
jgi:hypothetical protein